MATEDDLRASNERLKEALGVILAECGDSECRHCFVAATIAGDILEAPDDGESWASAADFLGKFHDAWTRLR